MELLITILAVIIIPFFLFFFTPLGRLVKRNGDTYLKRLNQFKRTKPGQVVLPKYPLGLIGFFELITAFGFMLGLPVLLGKFAGSALPRLFHLGAEVIFPLEGEFILMGISFLPLAFLGMIFASGIVLVFPTMGNFLLANRVMGQLQLFGFGHKTNDPEERHQQLEQIANEYDLRAWSMSNMRRQAGAFGILILLTIPMMLWLGRTGVWISKTEITINSFAQSQRTYSWDQVTGIEISIEDVGKQRTVYSPSFQLFFSDQTSVDLWASSFTNLAQELRDTCSIAQEQKISIYISPLATGRLSEFNKRKQQEILSVVNSPLCRNNAYTLQF